VSDRGTHEEDGPVTWEILFTPRRDERPEGEPLPKSPTGTRKRKPVLPGKEEASAAEVGRKQGEPELSPKVDRESEDCIRAETSGNGRRPDPAEQRRSVLVRTLRRET
jgi:hypothetical protein